MTAYRSTTLSLMARHCAAAGSHHEHGTREDGAVYQQGIAAHAALQAVAQERLRRGTDAGPLLPEEVEAAVRGAMLELIAHGRSFDGRPEPPMASEVAWAGAEIALDYMRRAGPPAGEHVEVGLAVDAAWNLVPYDSPQARLRCILDLVGPAVSGGEEWLMEDDSAGGGRLLEVTDYKSSWRAGSDDLDTVQRRIQGLLAWQAFGAPAGYDGIKLTVVNLRTTQPYSETFYPGEPEGAATFARWRLDLEAEMRKRDEQIGPDGWRPATPGAGCMGCPYLRSCPEARAAIEAGEIEDPAGAAVQLAVLSAETERLGKAVRAATKEAPIPVPGGFAGYREQIKRVPIADAPKLALQGWVGQRKMTSAEEALAVFEGFLRASGMTKTQLESVAKERWPGPKESRRRAEWVEELTQDKVESRFGVYRAVEEESDGDEAPAG